ncbi:carbohydrate binding domain-containing protein [Spirochaetia bacterium 38H-sp]|uniref:Carbohydrate binding domain-containing protein n=1 Tax=Rarispira pelagica TaxID=3141764 RepID=A0ABU9UCX8_9SPIR
MRKFFILVLVVASIFVSCDVNGTSSGASTNNDSGSSSLPVLSSDFEDGTLQDWQANGTGTASVSTSQVHDGSYSAMVTIGAQSWETLWYYGIDSKLSPDKSYHFVFWLYQETGSDQNYNLSLKYNDGSSDQYDSIIYQQTVQSGVWTKVEGDYTFPSSKGTMKDIYIEGPTSEAFYLDDFSILEN